MFVYLRKNSKFISITFATGVLLAVFFVTIRYRNFGGPELALAVNADFNYLEQLFQEEPEVVPVLRPAEVSPVKIPIFIYHSVRPYVPEESIMQDRFDITPELFEQQLVYLQDHGYTTVGLDELAKDINTGTTTQGMKPVALTFDDGWRNQYKYAFPLLKKYHMTATFYVYTKPIDHENVHYLTWDNVKEMNTAGMTIGSHTLSHPFLKNSSSADMHKEIFESKKVIEAEIGKPVQNFAQPFGYSTPEIEVLIKEAGYATARGTYRGNYHSKNEIYNLQGYFVSDKLSDFTYILNR